MAHAENFDLAHLGGIELFTPKFEESLHFFRDICAMREVERIGDSAYLRCWDEYQRYTLKLTASDTNGIGRTLYRTSSEDALQRRVTAIEASGLGHGWREPEVGVGRSYEFEDPDGHLMALYYDTEHYVPDDEDRPALKNQASAFPGRGINARRMDHINYLASDVNAAGEFWRDVMKSRESERVKLDAGGYGAWWFRFNQKSYDVVYSDDWTGQRGRFHHFAIAPGLTGRHSQSGRHLPRERDLHRVRPIQARHQPDVLLVCLGAGRQPHRVRDRAGPSPPRSRLAGRGVESGRAREGAGVGHEDGANVPHPRHTVR